MIGLKAPAGGMGNHERPQHEEGTEITKLNLNLKFQQTPIKPVKLRVNMTTGSNNSWITIIIVLLVKGYTWKICTPK